MTAVIDNQSFINGLSAARVMAYQGKDDPTNASIVIGSTRLEVRDSGSENLLAFIASDGSSPGQVIYPCEGDLPLIRIALSQVNELIAPAKAAASAAAKESKEAVSTIELALVLVDNGSALQMRTLTDGGPGQYDSRHYIQLPDVADYPIHSVLSGLKTKGTEEITTTVGEGESAATIPLKSGNVQSFTPDVEKKISAIAGVFKKPVERYTRAHPAGLVTLTCAGVFRGVVSAHAYPGTLDVNDPEVPVADFGLQPRP